MEPQSSLEQGGDLESSIKYSESRKGWHVNAPLKHDIPATLPDPMKDITKKITEELREARIILYNDLNSSKMREIEKKKQKQIELNMNVIVDEKDLDKNKGYATARIETRSDEQILGF